MFWVFILICLMLLWGVVQRGASMGKDAEYLLLRSVDKVERDRCRTSPFRARIFTAT